MSRSWASPRTWVRYEKMYLSWKARTLEFDPRLIDLAVQQNQDMARYVLARLLDMLSRRGKALASSRVLCVGAGYKPGVADTRHSRALRVMELLCQAGAEVDYSDDVIPSVELAGAERKSVELAAADPAAYDLVAVLSARRGLDLDRFLAAGVPVFDAARALETPALGDVERLLTRRP